MHQTEAFQTLVTELNAAIAQASTIPVERRLWSMATIARYAEKSVSTIQQRVVTRPDFPNPVREYPGAQPRWVAREVMDWFESKR